MAFVVNYRGMPVQVDSIEELDQLAEKMESQRERDMRKAKRAARPAAPRNNLFDLGPEKSIRGLVRELRDNGRAVLSALSERSHTDTELRALLNLGDNNKALAGALAGISKAAAKIGVDLPLEKKISRTGNGQREYTYSLSSAAIEEVQKALLNGPA